MQPASHTMTTRERRFVAVLVAGVGTLFFGLSYARFATFHNETFDLAFYARMAWGMVRGLAYEPIIGANLLGLHLSPILLPIGAVGALVGTVPALLGAQALSGALAAVPLARMGARHLGPGGGALAAVAYLLHPNLGFVLSNEAHPGSLALLPLALFVEALDRADVRRTFVAALLILMCREDLAAVTALGGVCLFFDPRAPRRRAGALLTLGSLGYLALFFLVLHPAWKPPSGSMEAHFGQWGGTLPEIASTLARDPGLLLEHFGQRDRLLYLPRVLVSLLGLPLLAPRLALPAAPVLGMCLLSAFPTTTQIDSHYLTPALPLLVGAALVGAARLRFPRRGVLGALCLATVVSLLTMGGLPPARGFDRAAFTAGPHQAALQALVAAVPPGASLQGPDRLLAHFAEREWVHRGPPPERGTDFVVLDVTHRERYARRATLLRTAQEPRVRDFLARDDHALVATGGGYLLLGRRSITHEERVAAFRDASEPADTPPVHLTRCLSVTGAQRLGPDEVRLQLLAHGGCPDDLAIRIGDAPRPSRADLLFAGHLSPAHLEAGDRVTSDHSLRAEGALLVLGALRSSGARPEPSDPDFVEVLLRGP